MSGKNVDKSKQDVEKRIVMGNLAVEKPVIKSKNQNHLTPTSKNKKRISYNSISLNGMTERQVIGEWVNDFNYAAKTEFSTPGVTVKVISAKNKSTEATVINAKGTFKSINPSILKKDLEATRHIQIAPYSEVKENLDRAAKKTIFGESNDD
jgi:hypothetical protein